METLLSVAGLLIVGAITPGPNNLVVWHAAARRGLVGALPAMAGIVLGGLVLLALAMSSMDALLVSVPALRIALLVAGCIYLMALGIGLIVHPDASNTPERSHQRLPEGFSGLFLFQFLNPKGWVLLVTAASAMSAPSRVAAYAQIAALFVVISLTCLSLWAALGRVFAVVQKGGAGAIWFERTMGCLLIGSAVLLLVERQ